MITFILSLVILIAGYFLYGKLTERIFGIDSKRVTPAITKQDGVDYIPMKPWRVFLIQFLNIAGVGPIFGAIMGAKFGTASFLWIVFGSILGGAVHDYFSGMISLRQDGASLPEIHGKYLGKGVKQFMRGFMVILMVLVGAVFVSAPAELLANLTSWNVMIWIVIVFAYYLIATILSIAKIIGRIYSFFGFFMFFMVIGIMFAIFYYQPHLPEFWEGVQNRHPDAAHTPIFPMMFISIACGAVSGFHATQSPLMARCMTNEKQGRPIFYGAMITEGVVALIWAAAASYFFFDTEIGRAGFASGTAPAVIVDYISNEWLGTFGTVLALLGVVAAPITSGDTAFRSARLIVADFMNLDQKPMRNRFLIAIPLFAAGIGILIFSVMDQNGFDIIWRYFSWANQVLSAVTLWAITVYLAKEKKCFWIAIFPAIFMTMVCVTFVFISPSMGLAFNYALSYLLAAVITLVITILFFVRVKPFAH